MVLQNFNLAGKTAIVTGCNTGLGQGMALALAQAGADIVGSSSAELGAAVKSEMSKWGKVIKDAGIHLE